MLRHIQNFVAKLRRPKRAASLRLLITDDGATLFADDQQAWSFRWSEVTRIDTYKHDLLTVDMICLDFTVAARQLIFPTDDEMQGFSLLCQQLCRAFPSISADWWLQVALPPFATQHSVLYAVPVA